MQDAAVFGDERALGQVHRREHGAAVAGLRNIGVVKPKSDVRELLAGLGGLAEQDLAARVDAISGVFEVEDGARLVAAHHTMDLLDVAGVVAAHEVVLVAHV